MYEKVLLPLDGSRQSECMLDHARMLAQSCGISKLILLRVVEPPYPTMASHIGDATARDIHEFELRQAEEYLSYVTDPLRPHCGNVETVVVEGNPANEIVEYAKTHDIDLIAMSTHGKSGIIRWTIGSVTRHVMDHWAGPLLTIPPAGCRL